MVQSIGFPMSSMGISMGDPQKMVGLEWQILFKWIKWTPPQIYVPPLICSHMFPYITCRQN